MILKEIIPSAGRGGKSQGESGKNWFKIKERAIKKKKVDGKETEIESHIQWAQTTLQ